MIRSRASDAGAGAIRLELRRGRRSHRLDRPPISLPDPQRHPRIKQRRRLLRQIGDFQKPRRERVIALRGAEEFRDVPVDEAHLRAALALHFGVLQIAADCDLPRNVDKRAGLAEETRCDSVRAGAEALAQDDGFDASDPSFLDHRLD